MTMCGVANHNAARGRTQPPWNGVSPDEFVVDQHLGRRGLDHLQQFALEIARFDTSDGILDLARERPRFSNILGILVGGVLVTALPESYSGINIPYV